MLRGARWACRIMSRVECDSLKAKFLVKTLKLIERNCSSILTGVNADLISRASVSSFAIGLKWRFVSVMRRWYQNARIQIWGD